MEWQTVAIFAGMAVLAVEHVGLRAGDESFTLEIVVAAASFGEAGGGDINGPLGVVASESCDVGVAIQVAAKSAGLIASDRIGHHRDQGLGIVCGSSRAVCATAVRAACNWGGNVLPRRSDRRRMPAHAAGER